MQFTLIVESDLLNRVCGTFWWDSCLQHNRIYGDDRWNSYSFLWFSRESNRGQMDMKSIKWTILYHLLECEVCAVMSLLKKLARGQKTFCPFDFLWFLALNPPMNRKLKNKHPYKTWHWSYPGCMPCSKIEIVCATILIFNILDFKISFLRLRISKHGL